MWQLDFFSSTTSNFENCQEIEKAINTVYYSIGTYRCFDEDIL